MDGQDYIPFHKDCEIGMKGNKKICILTFNESDEENNIRQLSFRRMYTPTLEGQRVTLNSSTPDTNIRAYSGSMVLFNSEVQKYYKHGVHKLNSTAKRISLSFRQFEENM
jgi:hypothetical protein